MHENFVSGKAVDISVITTNWLSDMNALIFAVLIVFSTAIIVKLFRNHWIFYHLKIPSLNALPFIAELFYLTFKLGFSSAEERFQKLASFCFEFPDMVKVWLGPKTLIIVSRPDRIQKVLMSQVNFQMKVYKKLLLILQKL